MKSKYDYLYAGILVLLLIAACIINNAIIKGILLLLFSGVLLFNTITKLNAKKEDRFRVKLFLGILLFFDSVLLLSSIYVVVSAILEAI